MILNASGCLDALATPEIADGLDAFVTKTLTLEPREGNPPVRITETASGMLNSIGLANPGIDAFVEDVLPELLSLGPPVWVSVAGAVSEDYAALCARLDEQTDIGAIELNVSCPNVESVSDTIEELVGAARRTTTRPLFVKLSAAVPDLAAAAQAAERAGADGLTLINTVRGLALDERTLRPVLGSVTGGYSGPALRPVALAAVYAAYESTSIPIVGVGGIETGRHALESIAVGAAAVALGTILFRDPWAVRRIRDELAAEAAALGFTDPLDACGIAHSGGSLRVARDDKLRELARKNCNLNH